MRATDITMWDALGRVGGFNGGVFGLSILWPHTIPQAMGVLIPPLFSRRASLGRGNGVYRRVSLLLFFSVSVGWLSGDATYPPL